MGAKLAQKTLSSLQSALEGVSCAWAEFQDRLREKLLGHDVGIPDVGQKEQKKLEPASNV